MANFNNHIQDNFVEANRIHLNFHFFLLIHTQVLLLLGLEFRIMGHYSQRKIANIMVELEIIIEHNQVRRLHIMVNRQALAKVALGKIIATNNVHQAV